MAIGGSGAAGSSPTTNARTFIKYSVGAANTYVLEVYVVQHSATRSMVGPDAKFDCVITNGTPPAGILPC